MDFFLKSRVVKIDICLVVTVGSGRDFAIKKNFYS